MENTYGIGVANRYALFLDDDADPLEVLKVQEQEKELKKKSKVAEKENKIKTDPPAKAKSAGNWPKKTIKETQNVKSQEKREEVKKNGPARNVEQQPRSDRNVKFSGENREERNNRRNRDEKAFNGGSAESATRFNRDDRPPRRNENRGGNIGNDNNEATESGPRGGRPAGNRPRQPRGNDGPRRNFENRGKREFDRQSGSDKTGVKPVDKRDGAGAHNWGSHKDEIDELSKPIDMDPSWDSVEKTDNTMDTTKEDTVIGDAATDSTPAMTTTAEEEVKELTLDEWKAQKAAGRQKPQYNLRKAGEGEDLTQWKKMYALNKKKGEEEEETDEEEYDASEYPQRVGRQKHVLDIEVRFSDSRRSGAPGSRTRGGPRGGRGGDRTAGNNKERNKNFRNNLNDDQNDEPVGIRGGDKGGNPRQNPRQSAPKVDDEHDFPSLG